MKHEITTKFQTRNKPATIFPENFSSQLLLLLLLSMAIRAWNQ